ncbi:MAG TPA: GlsB/YeaQ/YmgE family stress response membrane protein [Solirubrobacterales bacterium]|nr:GlsB/YeaQ/YmgE family stress response membrane protein [Solirubrobacterales bacterium]
MFAGLIARALTPGQPEPRGCIGTTAIGILGALIGGFIASALDIGEIDEFFDLGTWLIAIGGSILLLIVLRAFSGGRW